MPKVRACTCLRIDRMKTLLLVGSSIMEQWHKPESLAPSWRVVNRAVSGSTTADWIRLLPEVLDEVPAQAVFCYVGSNDIGDGIFPSVVAERLAVIRSTLASRLPEARFAWLTIIKSPHKLGRFRGIDEVNQSTRRMLPASDLVIDSDPYFLDAAGEPVGVHFQEDGLHLTPAAYDGLTQRIGPELRAWLR